ncbi:TonB family protein [Spirochaetes bacterium]|uniref:TonB family protein n=1 Tax=Candidatus Scatousia excrementipullorum TaxID=2840936 RepID=A0A9D9DP11_9BACT|nr:TonB family protein [Candidatus Scatousia excrementipullorum]
MSILGKYNSNLIEEDEPQEVSGYTTPAVIREDEKDLTLKKSIVISTLLHPTVVGAAWLIMIILALLGIHLTVFDKPTPKKNDIEFVLVDKEDTPINKNTPYRADRNSRAGGHHDPTRKVSMPSAPAAPTQKPKPASQASAPKKAVQPQKPQQVKQQPAKNPIQQMAKEMFQKPAPKPVPQPAPAPAPVKQAAKPNPPTARPSIKPPNTPKPVAKPTSGFQVPVPKAATPSSGGHYSTGPISGSGKLANGGSSAGGSSSSGRYTPAPVLAPTGSSGSKLGRSSSGTGGSAGGSGMGNPGPGNPNGRPGIDAIKEPDFGPYMRDLQRRIKMNWNPPKGNESKRVVLLFKIAKDGRLLTCSVFKSSGLQSADKAALDAVKLTAPFKPLPAEFKGQSIDIQFTFDYNVFGASGY